MKGIYHALIYQPLLNILFFFYQTIAVNDLGLAIVFLTIFIRMLLYPVFTRGVRYQMIMRRLQPHVKKIQDDHRHNQQRQVQALRDLYREHRVNPISGIFLIFLQLPILIALYQIFLHSLTPEIFKDLYGFLEKPTTVNTIFLGLINLEKRNILLACFAAVAQYFQGRMALQGLPKGENEREKKMGDLQRQMVTIGPGITLIIFINLPAAISLYWFISSLFSLVQQIIVNRQLSTHYGKLGNVR